MVRYSLRFPVPEFDSLGLRYDITYLYTNILIRPIYIPLQPVLYTSHLTVFYYASTYSTKGQVCRLNVADYKY
jgi:hypothetical protein